MKKYIPFILFLVISFTLSFIVWKLIFRQSSFPTHSMQKKGIPYSAEYVTVGDIPTPPGYTRISVESGSFAEFLRQLPLKRENNTLYQFDGKPSAYQNYHFAILAMDTGNKDLQQCADAVMRLRAEYLFQQQRFDDIHFNFTSGDTASYTKYAAGYRAKVVGNTVSWEKVATADTSYQTFRNYLDVVFTYAGTQSLSRELKPVDTLADMQIGDVFIKGGFPGHAMQVVDMAYNPQTDDRIFMLVQSFIPAQEIHIVNNPSDATISPWYSVHFSNELVTPGYVFEKNELMRF